MCLSIYGPMLISDQEESFLILQSYISTGSRKVVLLLVFFLFGQKKEGILHYGQGNVPGKFEHRNCPQFTRMFAFIRILGYFTKDIS